MAFRILTIALLFSASCITVYALPFNPKDWREYFGVEVHDQYVQTPLSPEDHSYYKSLVPFALNAYCPNLQSGMKVTNDATVLWRGGNGMDVQIAYIAYSPSLGLVVAHEGTNKTSKDSIANDFRYNLAPSIDDFSWLGDQVEIAKSIQESWKEISDQVYVQLLIALQQFPDANVVVTGHSLGASIALLDGLSLSNRLQKSISLVLFGLPRTGNKQFADAVDKFLPRQHHVVRHRDPVVHLPPRAAGFQHPSGEIFINDANLALDCSGQENPNCADNVHLFDVSDHSGPFFGVPFEKCTAMAI